MRRRMSTCVFDALAVLRGPMRCVGTVDPDYVDAPDVLDVLDAPAARGTKLE